MRRILALASIAALTLLASIASSSPALAATPSANSGHNQLSFALITPNTAVAPSGDRITVTGWGTFDLMAGTVHARGTFVHRNANGMLQCRGVWWATSLTGWTDFSVGPTRKHGGLVSMLVTHYCFTTGEIHTGIPMTVTSTRNAPAGSSFVEGVTVAEFTRSSAGTVIIRSCRKNDNDDPRSLSGRESRLCIDDN
jgi:hypothetical protein